MVRRTCAFPATVMCHIDEGTELVAKTQLSVVE